MLTTGSKLAPHPSVMQVSLDDQLVLLHVDTGQYYTLNETGAQVWQGLAEGLTLDEIARRIEGTYEVTLERAQSCVLGLARELVADKLAEPAAA